MTTGRTSSATRALLREGGRGAAPCLFVGTSLAALVALAGLAGPAAAAAAPADRAGAAATDATTIDEVVVTATRRETNLRDTPVSVAVTSGATLQKFNVTSFQSLTLIEPTITVNNQGLSSNQYIIRGVLSDIGSTTGFYVDESPLVGGAAVQEFGDGKPGLRLHDIERIEVLEGPQGTLFGAGSMAGTLRVITNKPRLGELAGGFSSSVGSVKGGNLSYNDSGFINVPIGDKVAIRVVGWGEFGGGYIDHKITNTAGTSSIFKKNVNDGTVWGGRFSALLKPTEPLSILLQVQHQETSADDYQSWIMGAGPYNNTLPTVAPFKDNYDLYSATGTYDADFGTFTAITSYGSQHIFHPQDTTQVSQLLAGRFHLRPDKTIITDLQEFHDLTGEFRFASKLSGPLQFVTGAYYERDDTNDMRTAVRADDVTGEAACYTIFTCTPLGLRNPGFSVPGLVPASNVKNTSLAKQVVEQWAVYGQVDYKILPNLTATAGIRYYTARVSDFGEAVQNIAPDWAIGVISTPNVTRNNHTKQHSPSYNFSLLYKATSDVSFYGRVASGFRVGGTNNVANLAQQVGVTVPASYDSDKLWNYEVGTKLYLPQYRVSLNASIYQIDWTGQQLAATDPSGAFGYTLNAGRTRIRGAEAKVTYTSDFGLSLNGGVTYADAVLRSDLGPAVAAAGTIGYAGDRLPRIPHWTFAGQAEYVYDLSSTGALYIRGNANYRGSSRYSFNNQNAFNQKLPSYFLLGLGAGYRTPRWDMSVFADNATDEVAIFGMIASNKGIRAYSAPPRTIGVRLQANF